ncbi:hypothetical protein E2C01_089536 [Portunus trituberculatus]|uniref:Uncharacterized protein n=1 Tax=Portunus trituberculatus TaxID=210409 RepID=A0A5B7JHH8_PORTR|nr:hypothetical protein [Portunus trituberculatus]
MRNLVQFWWFVLSLVVVLSFPVRERTDSDEIGQLVAAIVEKHFDGCLIMLVSTAINSPALSALLRLLERAGLWKKPEVPVIVVGNTMEVEEVLLHPSLRNTIHCLYLALHYTIPNDFNGM